MKKTNFTSTQACNKEVQNFTEFPFVKGVTTILPLIDVDVPNLIEGWTDVQYTNIYPSGFQGILGQL
jgi:hypothetical protein